MLLSKLIVSLAAIGATASSAGAQGICVPDTLKVTSVSGIVIAKFNRGETALNNAVVYLKNGLYPYPVIAKRKVDENGRFSFSPIRSGRYQLVVYVEGFMNFHVNLEFKRSKAAKNRKEITVIMGTDFNRPCAGSSAELRIVKGT